MSVPVLACYGREIGLATGKLASHVAKVTPEQPGSLP